MKQVEGGKKGTYCVILVIQNSRKCKLIYNDQKQMSGCLGKARGWEEQITKGQEETSGHDGYGYYLDCGWQT